MQISSDAQRYAYRQVADLLRADIASGGFAPGARIPGIRDLAERFDVSAQTVQKALGVLADDGLVRAGSTRGYYVREALPPTASRSEAQRLADLESEVRQLAERVTRLEGAPVQAPA